MPVARRVALLLTAALLALPLAACGNKGHEVVNASSEGTYLDVGGVQYQVQISRELNPFDREDQAYLMGLPADQQQLGPDEAWFAVFVRAQNTSGGPAPAATDFSITDTQDNVYRPIPLANTNVFRYQGQTIPKNGTIPVPDTVPYNTPSIGGSLLLFRVKNTSFDNRPLVLSIQDPDDPQQHKTVDLDV